MKKLNITPLEEMFERIKQDILQDVRSGIVPINVLKFSELHDFVDANCYGRCEAMLESLTSTEESRTEALDAICDVMVLAMDKINKWLESGGMVKSLTGGWIDGLSYTTVKLSQGVFQRERVL